MPIWAYGQHLSNTISKQVSDWAQLPDVLKFNIDKESDKAHPWGPTSIILHHPNNHHHHHHSEEPHQSSPYLIIVIFFTLTRFLELKFYTQMRIYQDKLDFALSLKLHIVSKTMH